MNFKGKDCIIHMSQRLARMDKCVVSGRHLLYGEVSVPDGG